MPTVIRAGNSPYIVQKVTTLPNGQRRKRPVYRRDGKLYPSLKAAKSLTGGRSAY